MRRLIQAHFVNGGIILMARAAQQSGSSSGVLQSKCTPSGIIALDAGRLNLTGSIGRPIPEALRQKMESFFRTDFSAVRIHVGSHAQSIGAHAFTTGSDIYFAHGQYAPDTPRGQQLLGHELAHVVQQRAGRVQAPVGAGTVIVNQPALEAEADRLGARAATFVPAPQMNAALPFRTAQATAPVAPTLQRKVLIGTSTKPLPATGAMQKEIWAMIKIKLLNKGLSPHGLLATYYQKEYLKSPTLHRFASKEDFAEQFVEKMHNIAKLDDALQKQISKARRRVKHKRRVKYFKFGRPAWPKGYREQLGAKGGDDLRHVVRNATILKALVHEYDNLKARWSEDDLLKYYREMATKLGVPSCEHSLLQMKAIYNKLYLNPHNLFPAAGGVNRAIGLSADKVTAIGLRLRSTGEAEVSVQAIIREVKTVVNDNIDAMSKMAGKMSGETRTNYLSGLAAYNLNLNSYLNSLELLWKEMHGLRSDSNATYAESADLASDVIDVGANLGFDVILAHNVAERQAALVEAETKMQPSQFTSGRHELTRIMSNFLESRTEANLADPAPPPPAAVATRSARAGLVFPVGRLHRRLGAHTGVRVQPGAAVYLGGVMEYLTAELLELAGNEVAFDQRQRIDPSHLRKALYGDEELRDLLEDVLNKQDQ
ncbi:protein of unknown function [Duganella sp. CF458]|uniref:eCIS core domain-containing protein n=1 Tax=Duganella sp. CF458 TaxID=1884368 RepID=UPI0008EF530F|nr:DUF4157 domain-containing protein [Duganella sp. CF458]SFH00946.1 protein of unknown function [Duganella sp. CF458]